MPADPWTVLLVPSEGDPAHLVAEGPCGARPPVAWCQDDEWHVGASWWREWSEAAAGKWDAKTLRLNDLTPALVLVHEGEVVVEGYDWAWHRWAAKAYLQEGYWPPQRDSVPTVKGARSLAQACINRDVASRVVVLDREGREVSGG